MYKTVLFLLAFFIQSNCFSQVEFAPAGAEWHYRSYLGWLGDGVTKIKMEGDTIINGKTFKIISKATFASSSNFEDEFFISQKGDSIFLNLFSSEYFLFKNKMEVGETHTFPYLSNANTTFEVMEAETEVWNGVDVQRYRLKQIDPTSAFETYIYDRFGPEYGFWDQWLSSPWDGNDYYLRCYQDDNFAQVNVSNEQCEDGFPTTTNESQKFFLKTFPNPVTDKLNISFPQNITGAHSLSVYHISGKITRFNLLEGKADVSQLPPGFYVGQILMKEQAYFLKFIKQ